MKNPFTFGVQRLLAAFLCLGVMSGGLCLLAKGGEQSPHSMETTVMQFDHIGLITTTPKPGEKYVAATKVWVTDMKTHPFHVEWLRFEPDSPVTGPVRNQPHVAYCVESISAAAKGLKVLLEPFDAGIATVGFYETDDGAVVEFMEYPKESK